MLDVHPCRCIKRVCCSSLLLCRPTTCASGGCVRWPSPRHGHGRQDSPHVIPNVWRCARGRPRPWPRPGRRPGASNGQGAAHVSADARPLGHAVRRGQQQSGAAGRRLANGGACPWTGQVRMTGSSRQQPLTPLANGVQCRGSSGRKACIGHCFGIGSACSCPECCACKVSWRCLPAKACTRRLLHACMHGWRCKVQLDAIIAMVPSTASCNGNRHATWHASTGGGDGGILPHLQASACARAPFAAFVPPS